MMRLFFNKALLDTARDYYAQPHRGYHDTGHFDDDGDLFVTGRVDDMIITGGENVSPVEIESCLSLHETPAFLEALLRHEARTQTDIVDRRDVPAQMMQARTFGLHEGDHVMVASVDAVHERDEVTGTIRETQVNSSADRCGTAPWCRPTFWIRW